MNSIEPEAPEAQVATDPAMHVATDHAAYLTTMVRSLRKVFWTQVTQLASACCVGQVLDGALLDRQQLPSYELAFAAAELLAAETVLSRAATGSDLRGQLAVTFVADNDIASLNRL